MYRSTLALSSLFLLLTACPTTDGGKDGGDDTAAATDNDADGFSVEAGDCDDANANINPDADELCDEVDNNCDGTIDEDQAVDAGVFYADADGDGYGDPQTTAIACTAPTGHIEDATDCDDSDAALNQADEDGDAYTSCDGDCDDVTATTYPDADEYCDEIDNNCDGTVDEDPAVDAPTWYADTDNDGYGDVANSTNSCAAPSGYLADDTDCDDSLDTVYPGADEYCNGTDDDCDGTTDEDDAVDALTWYDDSDQDGYGDPAQASLTACAASGDYTADNLDDCNDSVATTNPGATETWNGVDDNCDGSTDEGVSGDLAIEETQITGAATVASSGTTDVTFLISNSASVDVDVDVDVVHSTDSSIDTTDTQLASITLTVPAADSVEHTETITLPSGLSNGTDYIGVLVDPADSLPETDETNNDDRDDILISTNACNTGYCCFSDTMGTSSLPYRYEGALSTSDHVYNGSTMDDLEVELTSGTTYEFFASSEDFDSVLTLYGSDCLSIDSNDDTNISTNYRSDSHLSFTPTSTGTYTLVIAGYGASDIGDYDLVLNTGDGANCFSDNAEIDTWPWDYETDYNSGFSASLSSADASTGGPHGSGYPYDDIEFVGEQDSALSYEFDMDSDSSLSSYGSSGRLYDPELWLMDPECNEYTDQDDDGSSDMDHLIQLSGLPYDGIWTLVAGTDNNYSSMGSGYGDYILTASR